MKLLFDKRIWKKLEPYVLVSFRTPTSPRFEFVGMPDDLRVRALIVKTRCVACGRIIHPIRARLKASRSRIAGTPIEERNDLFYAPTCLTSDNPGCSRTREAKDHYVKLSEMIEIDDG